MAAADRAIARPRPGAPDERPGLHLVAGAPLDPLSRADLGRRSLVDIAAHLERLLPAPHPVGLATDPRAERLRFRHTSSLGFCGDEVAAVELAGDPPIATVTTSLLGLCGVESPLPLYLLDDADRDDDHGAALRGLLDIIHHRLISLLLRALRERDLPESLHRTLRERDLPESPHHDPREHDLPESPHHDPRERDLPESPHRTPRERDLPESPPRTADDPWLRRLLALVGLRECPALPLPVLVRLLPVWASGVRSPALLAAALHLALDGFLGDAAVRVEPWTGGWQPIDHQRHTRLGEPTAVLGDTAVLGTDVLHPAGAATIVIAALPGERTRAFSPGGPAHARIAAICRAFTPVPLRFELAVETLSRPLPLLGERRLGDDLWLGDDPDASPRHLVPLT